MRCHNLLSVVLLLFPIGCGDERVDYICERVKACGGLQELSVCGSRIKDALSDGRTSAAQASACAACVSREDNDCKALLVTRDCDNACSGIDLITDMYTTAEDRQEACQASDNLCGNVTPDPKRVDACTTSLAEQVVKQPKLDQSLSQCVNCLRSAVNAANTAQKEVVAAEGASSVTSACNGTTCAAPCTNFQGLIAALANGAQADFICQAAAVTCQPSSHFTLTRDECVSQLSGSLASPSALQTCASCLGTGASCADLFPDENNGGAGGLSVEGCSTACAGLPGFQP
ncbi:MAG TPA: hypothetical protein VG937_10665 [Polyangiaceae bacterium]|nr:hypothetical protein [Polyangiaceae bacterium]